MLILSPHAYDSAKLAVNQGNKETAHSKKGSDWKYIISVIYDQQHESIWESI